MEVKLEVFVAALLRQFNEKGTCSHPSYAYGVALELINTLTATERKLQLLRLLSLFDVVGQEDCSVAHVVAAGSLVVAGGHAQGDELPRWVTAMHGILSAHPPFPAEILSAVYFCVAHVALSGRSFALVKTAGASLRGGTSDASLTEDIAVGLLVECADALVRTQRATDGKDGGGTESGLEKKDVILQTTELKDMLITYAFDALSCSRIAAVSSSLLSRRVLIPLLRSCDHETLKSYIARVQSFLWSLSEDPMRRGEVVVITASLFDYLFSFTDCDEQLDYRCSANLWNTLHAAFWDALTCDVDAGRRANMLLRAEYLLKRIVDLTYDQQVREKWKKNVFFNRYFLWVSAVSHSQWSLFFTILESTNEFGMHIVQPVLKKLDVLTESLANDAVAWRDIDKGRIAEVSSMQFSSGLHPLWVELLFLKILLHPNTTVRKCGLRRLWSLDSTVLALFSSAFVFTKIMETSLDPQLCTGIDRAPRVAHVPTMKGSDEYQVVHITGSLAEELGTFYARIFQKVLRTADERKEAMRRMVRCVTVRPSVYGVTMLLCVFHSVAEALAVDGDEGSARMTLEMITDTGVLQELSLLLRDSAHETIPFWLDVRFSAVAFNALLHFALIDPAVVRQCNGFWRLLCTCGSLGNPGGGSAAAVDSVGHVGVIGTCIHPCFLNDQLLRVSRKAQIGENDFGFLRVLLQTSTLLDNVRQFLCTSVFDEVRGKELFFLTGALDMGGPEDRQLLGAVAHEIATAVLSFARRPYSKTASFFAALFAFVELSRSLGAEACTQYFLLETAIDLADAVYTLALSALRQATKSLLTLITFEEISGEVWDMQQTNEWDVIVAAALFAGKIALFHDLTGERTWSKVRKCVNELLVLLNSDFVHIRDVSVDDTTNMASNFAKIVVARNISRLLQAVLCGLIVEITPIIKTTSFRGVGNGNIPCRDQVKATSDPPCWIRKLMQCPLLRLSAHDTPCFLTGLSWATVLAQYYGGIYNAVFILCNFVDPCEHPELVVELQNYALDQVECCWGTNLASVYDILAWVAATSTTTIVTDVNENDTKSGTNINIVDHRAIIKAMFNHLGDVGSRFYGRVSVLAFNVLSCALIEHTELVKSHVLRALLSEADSERSVYLAAVMMATEVLRDPEANWPRLKDILLHVAVLYNPGREEENFETIVAATEPLLLLWSESLREKYPPTVRLSSVARALSISTILWCCHLKREWAVELSLELLSWNFTNSAITPEPCRPNSKPHRCRIRLWQLLCSLLPLIDDAAAQHEMLKIVVNNCLSILNSTSVRHFIELYALKLLNCQPSLYGIVDAAVASHNIRPQIAGSYLLIMINMILQQLFGRVEQVDGLFETFVQRLFQLSTSNHFLLRTTCHIGLYYIYQTCLKQGKTFCGGEKMIMDYIAFAPEHLKFREKFTEQLIFNLDKACTPRQLFCVRKREGNNFTLEAIPPAAFERMRYFNHELCCIIGALSPIEQLRMRNILDRFEVHRTLESLKSFSYIPHTEGHTMYSVDYTADALELITGEYEKDNNNNNSGDSRENKKNDNLIFADGDENIQRKITPWWDSLVHNELHMEFLTSKKRQPFIVICSLLQNPVNVAGLFRCGEIFAMEKIVVSDPALFEHPHFVATARSSELWLPWDSVPVRGLAEYLSSLRLDGYKIIGIEQTSASVSMPSYLFPERVAILLGAEGHGVPAEFLPLLDACVEIPQFGLIRSLNVHVAGAIVMYEYTRQYLMK